MKRLFLLFASALFSLFVSCDPVKCPEVVCRSVEETIGRDRKLAVRVSLGEDGGFTDRGYIRTYPMYDNTTDMTIVSYARSGRSNLTLFLIEGIRIGGRVGNGNISYDGVASSIIFDGTEYTDIEVTMKGTVKRREVESTSRGSCPGVEETYVMELDIRFVLPEYIGEEGEQPVENMAVRIVAGDAV